MTRFKLSAFGDEIAADFAEQLKVLNALQIPLIDLRAAWETNVRNLTDEQVSQIKKLCADYKVEIACIGSPIGKTPIVEPIENEIAALERVAEIAHELGTNLVRIFSFYPQAAVDEGVIAESIARLKKLCDVAASKDIYLLLENEKGLVGDLPERMLQIMQGVNSQRLQFLWDPANFVQCGAARQVEEWWERLGPYTGYVHIKDALLADGTVCPAGEGDGQIALLLKRLAASGYEGVLALEPHLLEAKSSSGFSGPELMKVARDALRDLIAEVAQ